MNGIFRYYSPTCDHTVKLIAERQLESRINWTRLVQAIEEKNGAPLDISR